MAEVTPLPATQSPFMYRVKGPQGIVDDFPTPAEARQAYDDLKLTLLPGETASYHRCAQSSKPHPGGGPPGSEQPELWFDCRDDPQGLYEEYTAPEATLKGAP
jgi:hypothetical protein